MSGICSNDFDEYFHIIIKYEQHSFPAKEVLDLSDKQITVVDRAHSISYISNCQQYTHSRFILTTMFLSFYFQCQKSQFGIWSDVNRPVIYFGAVNRPKLNFAAMSRYWNTLKIPMNIKSIMMSSTRPQTN